MEKRLQEITDNTEQMDTIQLAKWLHDNYQTLYKHHIWDTQEKCKVEFFDLPIENQKVMIEMAILIQNNKKKY